MRKTAVKFTCFLLLTAAVFYAVNRLAVSAGRVFKDGAAIICEQKRESVRSGQVRAVPGRENVLFMGNSRILAGIIPARFDKLSGGSAASWNVALPALPIAPHYFLLRDYLKRNPAPSHIVLSLSVNYGNDTGWYDPYGLFSYYANQGMTFAEARSYLFNRHDKTVIGNYLFPARMYTEALRTYLVSAAFHRGAIATARAHNADIIRQMLEDRGYFFIRDQARFPDGRLPDDFDATDEPATLVPQAIPDEMDLSRDPYVKLFFELCRSQNIRVLLIEPAVRQHDDAHRASCPRYYQELLNSYRNVAMARDGWRQKIYPNRLFSDPTHLNTDGATRFTAAIWAEFAEAYRAQPAGSTRPAE